MDSARKDDAVLKGWLYVAVVTDLYSRRVVGWPIRDHLCTDQGRLRVFGAVEDPTVARALLEQLGLPTDAMSRPRPERPRRPDGRPRRVVANLRALRCVTSASMCFGRAQIGRHFDPNRKKRA
jgi:hypothetical protein